MAAPTQLETRSRRYLPVGASADAGVVRAPAIDAGRLVSDLGRVIRGEVRRAIVHGPCHHRAIMNSAWGVWAGAAADTPPQGRLAGLRKRVFGANAPR